jgi:hypothetical protein
LGRLDIALLEASRAIRQAEVGAAKTIVEQTKERFDLNQTTLPPTRLMARPTRSIGSSTKIATHIPVKDMSRREDGSLSREDFKFDKDTTAVATEHVKLVNELDRQPIPVLRSQRSFWEALAPAL